MLYEHFANESEFRAGFVRPLLTRLNFIAIAELHGIQEFGKDFVFSELTPFGFVKHNAAVVKHEKDVYKRQAQNLSELGVLCVFA